ncbi:nicotinate (nicotinamide) nucleotide adenylyltransferase [Persephonella atlantica]|uniref:Probable nicotinate-nucleotide adenylyltransferase n=1 Tax=Persephonella atlantica TaxID=2699429 RepID=A0ABS1GG57_9AQUI|nr:nicotinate (nicotinamide) nucleotide adenylyltransferase [Persephonella atlantica]MBK3331865.1 nicotinate (nicotinamide) nucleotide adenylyltransferase [Persephonella atlantica]
MVGLYGGSFDPVHIGHLRIAEDVREYYGLDRIIFVPAYHSPLKRKSRASASDRLHMLKISIQYNPFFDIDDLEIKRKGKSYTIDTIKHYTQLLDHIPVFIVGTDAFLTLHRWKNPQELICLTNFIVLGRGKDTQEKVKSYVSKNFPSIKFSNSSRINRKRPSHIYFFDSRRIDISSTEIRRRVKAGKSIKYLVLPEVEKYILLKKLYRG